MMTAVWILLVGEWPGGLCQVLAQVGISVSDVWGVFHPWRSSQSSLRFTDPSWSCRRSIQNFRHTPCWMENTTICVSFGQRSNQKVMHDVRGQRFLKHATLRIAKKEQGIDMHWLWQLSGLKCSVAQWPVVKTGAVPLDSKPGWTFCWRPELGPMGCTANTPWHV